jgi:hypothetical protein
LSAAAAAIKDAWESTGAEFQRDYIFQSAVAEEFKKGARRVL